VTAVSMTVLREQVGAAGLANESASGTMMWRGNNSCGCESAKEKALAGASTPLYVEIAEALRQQARRTPAGQPLPSETELAATFGVSRMTARQAVKALQAEGMVYRVPGAGTFSSGSEKHRAMGQLRSFTSEMSEKGSSVRSQVIKAEWIEPTPEGAADLGLAPYGRAVQIVRVRYADDTPMAVESVMLTARCSFVLTHDLNANSLHAILEERGIIPTEAFGTLVAASATEDDAARLGVAVGSPLLVERRRIDDQHGTRIETTETRYVGGRYVFDVHLRRP
jgi:GntR family transcriptional regulator